MHSITNWLQTLPAPAIYAVIAGLVFAEDALFFGFVLPAETSVVIGGFLASQGVLSVGVLAVIVVVAAIVGDTVGYEVGRHFGGRILETRPLRVHRERVASAQNLIRRRGPSAVFLVDLLVDKEVRDHRRITRAKQTTQEWRDMVDRIPEDRTIRQAADADYRYIGIDTTDLTVAGTVQRVKGPSRRSMQTSDLTRAR